ncbi:MAG: rod-binding protein [Treponema sp.]
MTVDSVSSITRGEGALNAARLNTENAKFSELLDKIQSKNKSTLSSSQIAKDGRLNGDFAADFSDTYKNPLDKAARPTGAAANQANPNVKSRTIDKTSELYEKSLELESYFVKQMISSMRKTVTKSALGGDDFGGKIYEDMLFDEYSAAMTKNAGFGLADQIYLQLSK